MGACALSAHQTPPWATLPGPRQLPKGELGAHVLPRGGPAEPRGPAHMHRPSPTQDRAQQELALPLTLGALLRQAGALLMPAAPAGDILG